MSKEVSKERADAILKQALGSVYTANRNPNVDDDDLHYGNVVKQPVTIKETVPIVPTEQSADTLPAEESTSTVPTSHPTTASPNPTPVADAHPDPLHRTSSKQRKASLDEYREAFMVAPKITDRQPVFVSRETRDRIDETVRRFGERKMSVSGFLENIARHHFETYSKDLEQWRRL